MPFWAASFCALTNAATIAIVFNLSFSGVMALSACMVFSVVAGIRLEEKYGEKP